MWQYQLEKHQIMGWRAVSAARLKGEGSRKRFMFFSRDTSDAYTQDMHAAACSATRDHEFVMGARLR